MSPAKRWMTVAVPAGAGWRIGLERVGALDTLLVRLRLAAAGAAVAFGVDAPIGLPMAMWRAEGFPAFLRSLTAEDRFFTVCAEPGEIGREQPFYPRSPRAGMRRRELLDGLGLDAEQLLRACERRSGGPPAAPLFWTLGANQAGKGALCLWRELLGPALRSAEPPALWPFDGALAELLRPGRVTIAECYPADAMRRMCLGMRGSKRRQADRAAVAGALVARLAAVGAVPDAALAARIADGFGASPEGEDPFDSLIGLARMLEVVRDPALDELPAEEVRRWEGWILGRPVSLR